MKKVFFLIIILILTCCSPGNEFKINNADIYGTWEGNGQFANVNMTREYGTVSIKIDVKRDSTFTGTIGDAKLILISLVNENGSFKILAKLNGKINNAKSFDKDHLIIFGTIKEDDLRADFQLKSNFIFDFSMRVGGVTLTKLEN